LSCAVLVGPASAYEGDVHYGLTHWLALKAGFQTWQADAIALGNVRVDSGTMSTLDVILDYACVGKFADAALAQQQRHYPAAVPVPAPPAQRAVEPGSPAARKPLVDVLAQARGKEGQFLGLYGGALHTLQDSWSHAGVPAVPSPGAGVHCDPMLSSTVETHEKNLTWTSPAEVLSMARATYAALAEYPPIQGVRRRAQSWETLATEVTRFAEARTKTEKRDWFVEHGMANIGFLEGITLPDGARAVAPRFEGRNLPPLPRIASVQHDVGPDIRAFFDGLVARWLGREPMDELVVDLAGMKKRNTSTDPRVRQLAAKMKLWKVRDHGAAAQLAHLARPLDARQLAAVDELVKRSGYIEAASPEQAFLPLIARGPNPSPILPYVIRELPSDDNRPRRAIAIARLKHAPYDTVGWVAERSGADWRLVDLIGVLDQ
jgi:hypothetical protein